MLGLSYYGQLLVPYPDKLTYSSRIPHGFYEKEMQAYFSQFGEVTRLRISRNRKTGRSKHYAFVEFASYEVANIVAQTMNNYLLFGHILKVHIVPPENIHAELWKGANKRFKVIPRNRMEAKALAEPKSRKEWKKKIATVSKKRTKQVEKLKSMDYEFDVPTLKSVNAVPEKNQTSMVIAQDISAEDGPETTDAKDTKKEDKDKHQRSKEDTTKGKSVDHEAEPETHADTEGLHLTPAVEHTVAADVSGDVKAKKPKKDKKHKEKHSKKHSKKEKVKENSMENHD
jgi:nucleolar protein 15